MPRLKPVKTIADLTVLLERKRKKFKSKFAQALKSRDAVRAAEARFRIESILSLRAGGDFRSFVVEEYKLIQQSRRPLAQRDNARSSGKKRHLIGRKFTLPRGDSPFSYHVPITLLKFAENAARKRLAAGPVADKLVWKDLLTQLRKFDPTAHFTGEGSQKESIVFTLNGQNDSISWYAFERVLILAGEPEANMARLVA